MESLVSRNSSAILCQSLIQLLPWNDSRFTPACQTRICHLICEILLWVSAKEPHKKPEELRESLYNNSITKGSPRIPSKNILLCPSIHMWKKKKKSASEVTAARTTSASRSAEITSPPETEVFAAAAIPCSGQLEICVLCSLLLPPNLERRKLTETCSDGHDLSICFWLLQGQYTKP